MTGGLSLRTRLLAGIAAVIAALAIVAIVVTSLTRSHLVNQIDSQLGAATRERAMNAFNEPPEPRPLVDQTEDSTSDERFSNFYEATVTETGFVDERYGPLARSGDVAKPAITRAAALESWSERGAITVGSVNDGDTQWRMQAVPSLNGQFSVIALPLTDVDETIDRLILIEVIATTAVAVVLGAVSWWVIRLGIKPVKQMTVTAATIAAGDLSQRVPDMPPSTEAGQLGLALNHMLEQLEGAFNERSESQLRLQQFVADASHELRTPVTTIRGYAELYRLGGLPSDEELSEAMRRTEQEAVRMSRLVDDMLTLAKLGAGRPLESRPVDLAQLVADAASDARAVAPDRTIDVDAPRPVVVSGDDDRLRQVVANIVGNALTHTPPGSPIELRAVDGGGQAVMEIVDHGPGMTPEVAAKVTERFYRADPARARDRGGSGLGMAIVDATVSAHGGSISVVSALGRGTTVRVTLPRAPADTAPLPPPGTS